MDEEMYEPEEDDDSVDFFDGIEKSDKSEEDIIESIARQELGNDDITHEIEKIAKQFDDPNSAIAYVELLDGTEIEYTKRTNPRCNVCRSEFCTQAEKVYIENGKSLVAAAEFFKSKGISIKKATLYNHLTNHCDFSTVSIRWMDKIEAKKAEISEIGDDMINFVMAGVISTVEDLDSRLSNCDSDKDAAALAGAILKAYALQKDIVRLQMESSGLVAQAEVEDYIAKIFSETRTMVEKIVEALPSEEAKEIVKKEFRNSNLGDK